jgi:formylglycine-generating enzyme required for sulfatase activity
VAREADGEPLLRLLALAIRVEPELLRAVRYLLPEADVGSEAAAWNHPQVHATPLAFYYEHDAIEDYRRAFRHEAPHLHQQVAALITAHHVHLSPAIRHEEQRLLAETIPGVDAAEAQEFLEAIVKTLHAPENAWSAAVRAWVHRMARRQHRSMWQDEALAASWASLHLEELRAGTPLDTPAGFELARVLWLLDRGATPQHYTLRQRGESLQFDTEARPLPTSALEAPGSPLTPISSSMHTVQVQRTEADGVSSQTSAISIDDAIPLVPDTCMRLRTDQQEVTIDSITRPEWAEAIGRNAQGLFVSWAGGQRRAYWIPPGYYPVRNQADEHFDDLEIVRGYWCDAAQALVQLHEGFRQPSWADDYGRDAYGLYAGCRIQGVYQRMRWISPGEFVMGSPQDEAERLDEETQHRVIVSRGFWLADTTCTQALWQAVMGENPSGFQGAERPVEQVSWDDVQGFIARLNTLVPEGGFRLPTEAEWEYACRAGTTTPFWFGAQITPEQVNYDGNYPYASGERGLYRRETVEVKALPCNGWGLYQMHGNVWEWCQDWLGAYPGGAVIDPVGPAEGEDRVLRGGSWIVDGRHARSAQRDANLPGVRIDDVGFRLARGQVIRGERARDAYAEDRAGGAG